MCCPLLALGWRGQTEDEWVSYFYYKTNHPDIVKQWLLHVLEIVLTLYVFWELPPWYTIPGGTGWITTMAWKRILFRIYIANYAAVMSQLYGEVLPCGETHNPPTNPWTTNSILKFLRSHKENSQHLQMQIISLWLLEIRPFWKLQPPPLTTSLHD